MAEYNGKLVLLREHSTFGIEKKDIWCTMIALDRSGLGIMGKVEWGAGYFQIKNSIAMILYVNIYICLENDFGDDT